MATKKYIEGLQKSIKDSKEFATNDLLGNPLDGAKTTIVGKWQYSKIGGGSAVLVFKEDGTIENQWNEKWTYEVKGEKLIVRPSGSLSAEDMVFPLKSDKVTTLTGIQGASVVTLMKLP
jgi:hypothetical protein